MLRAAAPFISLAGVLLAAAGCSNGSCYCARSVPFAPATPTMRATPAAVSAPIPVRVATVGKPLEVSGAAYKGVILAMPPDEIEHWDASSFWTPTEDDVRRLEATFPSALKAAAPEVKNPLNEYFRQYLGVVRAGRRLVLVFAFYKNANDEMKEWSATIEKSMHEEPLLMNDGGDYFIDAVYDLSSGTFDYVGPHGEA